MSEKKCVVCNDEGNINLNKCICGKEKIVCCGNCISVLSDDLEYLKNTYPDYLKKECCDFVE